MYVLKLRFFPWSILFFRPDKIVYSLLPITDHGFNQITQINKDWNPWNPWNPLKSV